MAVISVKAVSERLAGLLEETEFCAAFRPKVLWLQVLGSHQNLTLDLSKLNRLDFLPKVNRMSESGVGS